MSEKAEAVFNAMNSPVKADVVFTNKNGRLIGRYDTSAVKIGIRDTLTVRFTAPSGADYAFLHLRQDDSDSYEIVTRQMSVQEHEECEVCFDMRDYMFKAR